MIDFRDLATSAGGQVQCQVVCDGRHSEPDDWRDAAEAGEWYSRVGQGLVQPGKCTSDDVPMDGVLLGYVHVLTMTPCFFKTTLKSS